MSSSAFPAFCWLFPPWFSLLHIHFITMSARRSALSGFFCNFFFYCALLPRLVCPAPTGTFLSLHVSMLWDLMRRHCMTRCEEISVVVPAFCATKIITYPMQSEQRNSHPRLTFHLSMHTIYMCAHVFHCSLKLFVRFFFVASLCVFQA